MRHLRQEYPRIIGESIRELLLHITNSIYYCNDWHDHNRYIIRQLSMKDSLYVYMLWFYGDVSYAVDVITVYINEQSDHKDCPI